MSFAQEKYQPSVENLANREWFQDAKFGLFVHWGVYSVMAGGGDYGIAEWIMNQKQIPIRQYEKLPSFFNPTKFDPEEWVSMVKKAGMKYITITSKHHDGFAMYDSKVSDYDVVDRTPYGKDILKQLKEECDKQGIKLFFYYSQLDWHHSDYYPRGNTGKGYTGRPESGDWNAYIDYMNAQLSELLTNYGEVGGIWFDGMWDQWDANWRLDETYALIHKLQPGALIGSNHHKSPIPGEDFQMFERDLPGENTMGFNQTGTISELPLEMCETMNGSWGFNLKDQGYKSSKQLIQTMVKAAGYGANFLLNTGPMPNGQIQPENIDTLMIMGNWLEKYGETIYGTRKGPIKPTNWGATTQKGNTIYLHILELSEENLLIHNLNSKIKSIKLFDDGAKVNFKTTEFGTLIEIPFNKRQLVDTILKIEI
ncbi:alpha-L-fucosidase [Gaoshiqia sediminis]|uniref:alpha-L-fucosidase n=1 Tax=Gaoshiqia sediminis TaxID=2986998 RepID=A0AA41Y8P9_9BACT|nr:alpha-L-fucosidase [Gaoshiqia sediminis]MCW0483247.1 alpha-L-fucosidase [Gaoshiqia sediminis]